MFENLGKTPDGEILEKIRKSPNYIKGAFRNQEIESKELKVESSYKIFYKFLTQERNVRPHQKVPSFKTDILKFHSEEPVFLWLGHSSYFLFFLGQTILIDPILSTNASPIRGTNEAFEGTAVYGVEDIPSIDLLILTHDHYDHLDYFTIKNIHNRVRQIVCPLGLESHLIYWGVSPDKIQSLDWGDTCNFKDLFQIRALTSRHNSGRTMNRNQTLWCAYQIKSPDYNLFLAGDGGYGKHFKEIGERYGPFDFGTIENGQYNQSWPLNHMFPNQSAQAASDLKLQTVVPIHWGKFGMAYHSWNASITEFVRQAKLQHLNYCVPQIGQLYQIGKSPIQHIWWDFD